MKNIHILYVAMIVMAFSCNNNQDIADAYGNFQAKEIVISPEVNGKLLIKAFEEGTTISPDQLIALVDTTQLYLQKEELLAARKSIDAKRVSIKAQMDVLDQQKEIANVDQKRIQRMFDDGAATKKQLDDINGQIEVLEKQIVSVRSNFQSLEAEVSALRAKENKINDLIQRSKIHPPIEGLVLQSYVEEGELVAPGRPILKMADVSTMELKAYVSGDQLSAIKIGQGVAVKIDGQNDSLVEFPGEISWISSEAEFTPKNIQTRKERVSQVYAIKILVKNDGAIKINMPAEVYF